MIDQDFCVFILTHGRPDRVVTYRTLRDQGYTGEIFIIIDNEDDTADRYRELFGDRVIMFDKLAVSKTFDSGDNFSDRRTIIYARNACFDIARDLGFTYFLQLDDDYTTFSYTFTESLKYHRKPVLDSLDDLFGYMLDYYKSIPAVTIAFGQGGDLLGGKHGGDGSRVWIKRKAMNTFFCSTERPFEFVGRVNEDVNTYTSEGNRGLLFCTIFNVAITQATTQASSGGMTEMYLNEGTYIKSFYTVMYCPSFTRITMMGHYHKRIHHRITWNHAVPKIIEEKYRKTAV